MDSRTRDALLATASALLLAVALVATGRVASLWRPLSVGVGVVGALAVEALFVAETPVSELWARPAIQVGSALALLAGAASALALDAVWLVAAACWGLGTYFVLLVALLTGVWEP